MVTNQNVSICDLQYQNEHVFFPRKDVFFWVDEDAFLEDEVEDTDTAADEVPSVNEDDEDAFQEDEVEEEAARLNYEWLALFHSDTEDEYF